MPTVQLSAVAALGCHGCLCGGGVRAPARRPLLAQAQAPGTQAQSLSSVGDLSSLTGWGMNPCPLHWQPDS